MPIAVELQSHGFLLGYSCNRYLGEEVIGVMDQREASSPLPICVYCSGFFMLFVSSNNSLDEGIADDIFCGEFAEANAFN